MPSAIGNQPSAVVNSEYRDVKNNALQILRFAQDDNLKFDFGIESANSSLAHWHIDTFSFAN